MFNINFELDFNEQDVTKNNIILRGKGWKIFYSKKRERERELNLLKISRSYMNQDIKNGAGSLIKAIKLIELSFQLKAIITVAVI